MALFQHRLINAPYNWCYAKEHGLFFYTQKDAQVYAPFAGQVENNVLKLDNMAVTIFNVDIRDGKYSAGSVLGLAKDNVGVAVQKDGEYQDAFVYLMGMDDYEHKIEEPIVKEEPKVAQKKATNKKKAVAEEVAPEEE